MLPPMSLGDNIKKARAALGISQQAIATRFGISRAAVAQWENGSTRPDNDKLVMLAGMLKISLGNLMDEANPLPSTPANSEQAELLESWGYLLQVERTEILSRIKLLAAHNKDVMNQLQVTKRTVSISNRRTAQTTFATERRKKNVQ